MRFLKLILMLAMSTALFAQDKTSSGREKATLGVVAFDAVKITDQFSIAASAGSNGGASWNASEDSPFANPAAVTAFAEAATQRAVEAFVKTGRFTILDRTAMEKIMAEQNFQLTDNADPNSVSKIGALMGAQYLVTGQIQSVSTNPAFNKETNAKVGYYGSVDMQVTILDVSTGQVMQSNHFKGATSEFLERYESTPERAVNVGLDQCFEELRKWIRAVFPVEGAVYEITKQNKKEALRVSITCGSDIGVRKDDKFRVYYVTEIPHPTEEGKTFLKTTDVGVVVVKKVEADGVFSTCEVDRGGKMILQKMNEGQKLKVVSMKK